MMRYSYKIFISIIIILTIGFGSYGYWLTKELRSQYAANIEESLVDFSHVLASYLSVQIKNEEIQTLDFEATFEQFKNLSFNANIHGIFKNTSPINAYVTDKNGIVLFDSRTSDNVGKDFSKWNDVYLTLQGKYGARSTRTNINDALTSVFYIAAPIKKDGDILGVVSIIKPENGIDAFLQRDRQRLIMATILVLIMAFAFAAFFSYRLTRPINALTNYARKISKGETSRAPSSTTYEFIRLAEAFEEMRISLEGKKSIEQFVQHLTHELKSPLTAIQGAAEILRDDLSVKRHQSHFLA